MTAERLRILCLSHMPPSPPRFGAQARIHGLMTNLARRHDLTFVSLIDPSFDFDECQRALKEYCHEVVLIRNMKGQRGLDKRILQLRSLVSRHSFEHHLYAAANLQEQLDQLLRREQFDVVHLEFPYLGYLHLRQSPVGLPPPRLFVDSHEIAYDIVRQFAQSAGGLGRRIYAALDWRKLKVEELDAYRLADGVCMCSTDDEHRLLREIPSARTAVIPNAADVDYYQPRPADPGVDENTVVFFGLMSTLPNIDGTTWFVREIWPRILEKRPNTRFKIIGGQAPSAVLELGGPRIEVTGFVEDLRPHLASAAAIVVPLRLGGGTRLKIVEGMAMRKAIVSTTLGAEGIDAVAERDIIIADQPEAFATSVIRLLDEPDLASRIGHSARELAVAHYSWSGATESLERFYREVIAS